MSVADSVEKCRHPRDPTYAVGEDDFKETGYMPENEMIKSSVSIKHSRSDSVLLHSDARKLLQLMRGFRQDSCEGVGFAADLRREYVEEAKLIHEDVFEKLQELFPEMLQLQRLLLLDGVKEWDGWARIKSLLVSSQSHDMKRVHVEDFVNRFVRRCQINCVYEDFPSDAERRKVLEEEGYAIGHATGQGCNSLNDSLLQLLLAFDVI